MLMGVTMVEATAKKPGAAGSGNDGGNIISVLTAEHRAMLGLYHDIRDAVAARKYSAVRKLATQLHDQLHNHLSVEHLKLYTELRRRLENRDEEKLRMIHDLQREMYSIGRGAVDFIRQAHTLELNDANAPQFRTDLEGVGGVLVQRIRKEEEELYPLYDSL